MKQSKLLKEVCLDNLNHSYGENQENNADYNQLCFSLFNSLKLLKNNQTISDKISEQVIEMEKSFGTSFTNSFKIDQLIELTNTSEFKKTISFLDENNLTFINSNNMINGKCKTGKNLLTKKHRLSKNNLTANDLKKIAQFKNDFEEAEILYSLTGINVPDQSIFDLTKLERIIKDEMTGVIEHPKSLKNLKIHNWLRPRSMSLGRQNRCHFFWKGCRKRFDFYYYYVFKKMFQTFNCFIFCGVFCFCLSMVH